MHARTEYPRCLFSLAPGNVATLAPSTQALAKKVPSVDRDTETLLMGMVECPRIIWDGLVSSAYWDTLTQWLGMHGLMSLGLSEYPWHTGILTHTGWE